MKYLGARAREPAAPPGLLPDAPDPDALDPDIHGARTHWIRGFTAFRPTRCRVRRGGRMSL